MKFTSRIPPQSNKNKFHVFHKNPIIAPVKSPVWDILNHNMIYDAQNYVVSNMHRLNGPEQFILAEILNSSQKIVVKLVVFT